MSPVQEMGVWEGWLQTHGDRHRRYNMAIRVYPRARWARGERGAYNMSFLPRSPLVMPV